MKSSCRETWFQEPTNNWFKVAGCWLSSVDSRYSVWVQGRERGDALRGDYKQTGEWVSEWVISSWEKEDHLVLLVLRETDGRTAGGATVGNITQQCRNNTRQLIVHSAAQTSIACWRHPAAHSTLACDGCVSVANSLHTLCDSVSIRQSSQGHCYCLQSPSNNNSLSRTKRNNLSHV